jgi:hypothetical protein
MGPKSERELPPFDQLNLQAMERYLDESFSETLGLYHNAISLQPEHAKIRLHCGMAL